MHSESQELGGVPRVSTTHNHRPLSSLSSMTNQVSDHLAPWRDLHDKVVMVTGTSSDLGHEDSLDLAKAKAGSLPPLAASTASTLFAMKSTTSPPPPRSREPSRSSSAIQKSAQKAWDAFGHIDALINNAGVRGTVASALELSEEEWNSTFKTNLTGTWLVSTCVSLLMHDADKGGSIINISSISGLNRGYLPGGAAYNCPKGAVNTLTSWVVNVAQH